MDRGCYFQVGNALKLGMSIPAAFKIALNTWALWVQNTVDTNRTRVFFRTFEPSHWRYFSNIGTHFSNCYRTALRVSISFSLEDYSPVLIEDCIIIKL